MKMIVPRTITPAMIDATDVPEDDTYAAWSSGTTYAVDDIVYLASTTLQYVALASSTGIDPSNPAADGHWAPYKTATRWRPFDGVIERYASRTTSLYYEITAPGFCDSIALFNLVAGAVRVQITNGGGTEIYDETHTMVDKSGIRTFLDYLTWQPVYSTKLVLSGLPIFAGYTVRVTVSVGVGSTARLGEFVIGRMVTLGNSLFGTEIGGTDYSDIGANDFGERVPVVRAYSDEATYAFQVDRQDEERVKSLIAARRGQLTVFLTDPSHGAMGTIVYGLAEIPQIVLDAGPVSTASMRVYGVI